MIGRLLIALGFYEGISGQLGLPSVSRLSTTREWGPLIWGFLFACLVHLIDERRNT